MCSLMAKACGEEPIGSISGYDRYLLAEGLSLSIIKGCVPVDVSVYDIPKRIQDNGTPPPATFRQVFGAADEVHRDMSPVTHVTRDKHIPPFLVLHVADRPETKEQSHWFAENLTAAGIRAEVLACEGKTHGTINSELGLPQDVPTQAVFEFLAGARK